MLGNSLPGGPAQQTTELPKLFPLSTRKEYVMHFLHKVFPGILQVIISNGMAYEGLGRGCDEAKISEEERLFTEWGPGIQ